MYKTPLGISSSRDFTLGDPGQGETTAFTLKDPIVRAGRSNDAEAVIQAIAEKQSSFTDLLLKYSAGARSRGTSAKNKDKRTAKSLMEELA
jgi:hypothetical protein